MVSAVPIDKFDMNNELALSPGGIRASKFLKEQSSVDKTKTTQSSLRKDAVAGTSKLGAITKVGQSGLVNGTEKLISFTQSPFGNNMREQMI